MPTLDVIDGRQLADALLQLPQDEAVETVRSLVKTKRLSPAIHSLNRLLQHPEHRPLAQKALAHIGFPI